MLRRILFTLFVIIAIAGGVVGYLYYQKLKVPTAAAISAVPQNAAAIIQIRKTHKTWKDFKEKSTIWKILVNTPYFSNLNQHLTWLESIVNDNGRVEDALENSNLLISYHVVDGVNQDFLFSISVPPDIDDRYLDELIKSAASPDVYFSQRAFQNTIVYEAKHRSKPQVFSYALKKGVFIACFNSSVLELAINQLNENSNLTSNPQFDRVYKTLNTQSEISVMINHQAFFMNLMPLTTDSVKPVLNTLQAFGEWSALDFKHDNELITLSGLSTASSSNQFLSLFINQIPSKQTLPSILPFNTAAYIAFNISNFDEFYSKFKIFYGLSDNSQNQFLRSLGNEFALVYTDDADNKMAENTYLVGKPNALSTVTSFLMSSSDKAKNKPKEENTEEITEGDQRDKKREKESKKELEKSMAKEEKNSEESQDSPDSGNQQKVYEIRKLKAECKWGQLLGKSFGVITQNYFSIIDDYIVFGNSFAAIEKVIQSYQDKKTLNESEIFKSFYKNLNNNACLTVYNCPARDNSFITNAVNSQSKKGLEPYFDVLSKLEGAALQFTYNKGLYYTQMCLKSTSSNSKVSVVSSPASNSIWEINLDAPAAIKPKVVINHNNQSKEIIVQDLNNNLYLINNQGEILWKKTLEEPILSEITQVDRYKNNKLQYVFNTRNYIYMVDRNGNICDGFPVKLKYPATNEMAVFDYENTRDYRFMIACENNRVYNYDAKGENVNGWEFTLMKNPIIHQAQHFIINGKDYILVIDQGGEIRLVDRKGKSILDFKQKLIIPENSNFYVEKGKELSSSYIFATDSLGRVLRFKFTDRLDILELKPSSRNHFFDFKDINSDGKRDFIIADGKELNVYNQDQTLQFSSQTNGKITQKPMFFLFPDGKVRIGLVCKNTEQIYLLNADGKVVVGFPKNGTTLFSINDINNDKKFNLVVGTSTNKIYTYPLEN